MKYHWRQGNELELLINGEQFFPCVFDCIRRAKREILLETFIIAADQVGMQLRNALLAAAHRGVNIEVTADGYGTAELDLGYVAQLVNAGVRFRMFEPKRPMLGIRTNIFRRLHRKIIVADGETALIGGINFSAEHLRSYGDLAKQDYAVKVRGPVVQDIHRASRELLTEGGDAGQQVAMEPATAEPGAAAALLALRDNETHRTDIEEQYLQGIRNATEHIIMANAYFFPGYRILRELRNAAERGIRVDLILQGRPDKQYTRLLGTLLYDYLLRHGIAVYEYTRHPFHGKIAIIDQEWVTVGSTNLDPLSLYMNLEANIFMRDTTLNRQLHAHLVEMMRKDCQKIGCCSAMRGHWWRVPLMFLAFHFLRRFPRLAGLLPCHTPRIKSLFDYRRQRRRQSDMKGQGKSENGQRTKEHSQ